MRQITLNIPESKYSFFMELIKSLGFVKVKEEQQLYEDQQTFIDEVNESLNEVEKHMKGELKLKSADELLDEL